MVPVLNRLHGTSVNKLTSGMLLPAVLSRPALDDVLIYNASCMHTVYF